MDKASLRHFAIVAEDAAEEKLRRRREALKSDPLERVKLGLELARPFIGLNPVVEAEADRRMMAQADLHRRWRALHPGQK
jgi:hypothetical protein